jgi:hypothetical protein
MQSELNENSFARFGNLVKMEMREVEMKKNYRLIKQQQQQQQQPQQKQATAQFFKHFLETIFIRWSAALPATCN